MLASFADENFRPSPIEWYVYNPSVYLSIRLFLCCLLLVIIYKYFFLFLLIGGSGKNTMACDVIGTLQLK